MSQGRRLTALAAVVLIGLAGIASAAQWVWDAGNIAPQLLRSPVVTASQAAVRPVEGRPIEWWGRTQRRTDRAIGDPTALAGGVGAIVVAFGLITRRSRPTGHLALAGAAQERAPPPLTVP
jgi:hypothetical protein